MKTINEYLFSNGTDHLSWVSRNCERCWKMSRYNEKKDTYSQFRCSIDADIQAQAAGIVDQVKIKSYKTVQLLDCPYREEKQKVKTHRPLKGMQTLF